MTTHNVFQNPERIEVETGEACNYSIIWLHGLGGDGNDFEYAVPKMNLNKDTRFIFVCGPMRKITSYNSSMRGWYDSQGENFGEDRDLEGIQETAAMIGKLIEQENERGVPTENIFIIGFSQGGAATYFTGLRYPKKLAGVIALCTYLPFVSSTAAQRSSANQDTPVFIAHGSQDKLIPPHIGEFARDHLTTLGYATRWETYETEHSIIDETLVDIGDFIASIMSE